MFPLTKSKIFSHLHVTPWRQICLPYFLRILNAFLFPNSLAQEQLGCNSSKNKHVPCDAARLKYLPRAGQIFTLCAKAL